jgi:hypothetical protein
MNDHDEFYIGWRDKAPVGHGRAARRAVSVALALAVLAGAALAMSQRLIGVAFFEWGNVKEFSGVLQADPYPHLVLHQETTTNTAPVIAAPLVAPFKFGVKRSEVAAFDGKAVTLRATRIHRDGQLMLELEPGTIRLSDGAPRIARPDAHSRTDQPSDARRSVSLGRHTFRGEIVDSKCWMGVMNPGVLTPHRACAVRCISGGIPPMLLVRRESAPPLNLLLVSPDNQPVNDRVLDLVAEPVEITGEVVRQGELLTLRADPTAFRRLDR